MGPQHIQNIALVGGAGTVGSQILRHLLASPNLFTITLITREDSSIATNDKPNVTIKRGSYTDPTFLASAFAGQDAAVFALGFMAMDAQRALIAAALTAGVPWILPTEYAGDGANEEMVDAVPLFWPKRAARRQIVDAPAPRRSKFVGVVTNPWVPFSLQTGMFGIDPYEKRATLYEDAGSFNVSTVEQVGRAVAALLALPVGGDGAAARRNLGHYADGFVYVSSALTTQREMFEAALRATGTTEKEWEVRRSSCKERLRVAGEAAKRGDMRGAADGTFAVYMGEGMGGNYEAKAEEDREVLGLQMEDVDGFVKAAVKAGPFRVM